jgi:hypothetical protein
MVQLLVIANVPSLSILVSQMMEVMCSSEMLVLTKATQHNIQEDGLSSYSLLVVVFGDLHF